MRLRDGWVRWEAFRGHGFTRSERRVWSRLPLVTYQGSNAGVDFETFASTYFVEIIQVKARNMALK